MRRPADISRTLGHRGLEFTEGNAVELYDCGQSGYTAMIRAIASAQEFVHLETYTLRSDETGSRFVEALAERASNGVMVRLLYDAFGSFQLDTSILRPLTQAGSDVVAFNPLRRFYPNWGLRRRDHRKLLIVDNRIAFTGGLNIGNEYDAGVVASDGDAGWRDSHVAVRGRAVRDLSAVFLESWFRAGGAELPWQTLLDVDPGQPGSERCGVLPDGPVYRRRATRDLLVSELGAAERSARLTSPYFAPGRRVLEALERAAERGVRVELILAGRTDHPLLRRAARSTLERLLQRGVEVHEYVAAVLHAKSAVFDRRHAIVGSSNLDRQSFQHNYEVNLVFEGGSIPEQIDRLFGEDIGRSQALTLEALARRGPFAKMVDWIAAAATRGFV